MDKRQATLHPCIRASGAQLAPCWIIFRGKGNITAGERDFLNSLTNIRWAFQPKAWADGEYTMEWAVAYCDMLEKECPDEDHLLLLDELSCQMSDLIQRYFRSRRVLPVYIPGGCTDVLQPVDHHFGAIFKMVMNLFYKTELELNFSEWRDYKSNGSLSQSKRRMLMAMWADNTWGLLRTEGSFTHKCFVNTVLIKKDGSHSLKMKRLRRDYKPKLKPNSN